MNKTTFIGLLFMVGFLGGIIYAIMLVGIFILVPIVVILGALLFGMYKARDKIRATILAYDRDIGEQNERKRESEQQS